ncbi:MAG TPA: hypothetical protein VLF93_01950 [Candidatus Saccharimonadales bacterium]|nr:hypothetical protein [Candidatus Saccharimonadales bacterium]
MNNFAELFKKYRFKAEFINLSALADAFSEKGYFYELSTFCRWQKGKRIPTKRIILFTIVSLFIEREAITSISEANEFLEAAGHGYFTKKELEKLFSTNNITSQSSTI